MPLLPLLFVALVCQPSLGQANACYADELLAGSPPTEAEENNVILQARHQIVDGLLPSKRSVDSALAQAELDAATALAVTDVATEGAARKWAKKDGRRRVPRRRRADIKKGLDVTADDKGFQRRRWEMRRRVIETDGFHYKNHLHRRRADLRRRAKHRRRNPQAEKKKEEKEEQKKASTTPSPPRRRRLTSLAKACLVRKFDRDHGWYCKFWTSTLRKATATLGSLITKHRRRHPARRKAPKIPEVHITVGNPEFESLADATRGVSSASPGGMDELYEAIDPKTTAGSTSHVEDFGSKELEDASKLMSAAAAMIGQP